MAAYASPAGAVNRLSRAGRAGCGPRVRGAFFAGYGYVAFLLTEVNGRGAKVVLRTAHAGGRQSGMQQPGKQAVGRHVEGGQADRREPRRC